MNLREITPLILTFNEEANIGRTLDSLSWANRILIVDSGSTDSTRTIAESFTNVEVLERKFDDHTSQWNYGISKIATDWVLTLDADYVCTRAFETELNQTDPLFDVYSAQFNYCVFGHPLRKTLYPPRLVLFRVGTAIYAQDGHTQILNPGSAPVGQLASRILHDDRKSIAQWLGNQTKYATLETEKLRQTSVSELGFADRIRKRIFFAPVLTFFYCLFYHGLILDGWKGVYYTLQRVHAEAVLSLMLLDRRLRLLEDDTH